MSPRSSAGRVRRGSHINVVARRDAASTPQTRSLIRREESACIGAVVVPGHDSSAVRRVAVVLNQVYHFHRQIFPGILACQKRHPHIQFSIWNGIPILNEALLEGMEADGVGTVTATYGKRSLPKPFP